MVGKYTLIQRLRSKVSYHQGDSIICLREFSVPIGNGVSKKFYHLESGIIDGHLVHKKSRAVPRSFSISPSFEKSEEGSNYIYMVDSGVPLISRFSTKSFDRPSLDYGGEHHAWLPGGLGFGEYEFGNYQGIPPNIKTQVDLGGIELIIGDKQIKSSMGKKSVPEEETNSFLDLLNNTGGIEEEMERFDPVRKTQVAENLIRKVSELCRVYLGIHEIKESVLASNYITRNGIGGKISEWDSKDVHIYLGLKTKANRLLEEFDLIFQESMRMRIQTLPFLSADCLGFPSRVEPDVYLDFIPGNVLNPLQSEMKILNQHLALNGLAMKS